MEPIPSLAPHATVETQIPHKGQSLRNTERVRLHELERVVERGLAAFLEVAQALIEIRDCRLYRESHSTFEAFVRERFGLGRSTAYGLLDAARVAANVSPEGHQLSLSHLRALAPLEPAEQVELAPVVSELSVAEARRVIRAWRGQQRRDWSEKATPPLPAGTFRTIVADPPLAYAADFGDGLAADAYRTMSIEELEQLPIGELGAPDSHLYLWIGATRVPDGLRLVEAWGYRYTALLTWVKPGLGLGTWWRYGTEHVIFGTRGSLRTQPNLKNWFEAKRTRHSQKPEVFYELAMDASPAPYLELFARRPREGWTVWGDEVGSAFATDHALVGDQRARRRGP